MLFLENIAAIVINVFIIEGAEKRRGVFGTGKGLCVYNNSSVNRVALNCVYIDQPIAWIRQQ